ncbi:MAG: VCBS domain-containing protein, partial [Roseibium sp.]|uniref:VCBS domain-containing protein n=1 Tax=Roseibium sp. TaxID=1936156 RepID=UPI0026304600
TALVDVAISPVEDAPVITGASQGTLEEDRVLTASGSLITSDADPTDHPVFTAQTNTAGTYGTFSLTSAGDWFYLLDNQAAQVLSSGEVAREVFTAVANTIDGETVSQQVTLFVTGVNDAPASISLTAYAIDENTASGTALADVLVSDPDANDNHSLQLLTDAGGLFVLDGATLRVADGAVLDFEAETSHTIDIEATDGSGASVRRSFTINVNDLDESFVATGDEGSSITGDAGDNEIVGGTGDDTTRSGLGKDVITLGDGRDKVIGTAEDFDGDTITDLNQDDELILLQTLVSRDSFEFSKDTGEVTLDTNGDGIPDTSFNLKGDFGNGDFLVFKVGSRTFASFETYLPSLEDGQALHAGSVNGIANQDFLNGDGGRSFAVKLVPVGYAGYRNTLGVYEISPNGDIVGVRILVADATSSPRASARIEGVEDGNTLGFFLLQDAGRFASRLSSEDTFNFVDSNGNTANVDDGPDIWFAVNGISSGRTALHSYAQDMNTDGLQHVLSGVNPDGTSMTIGFEDVTGGGDRDYEDLVFKLTPDDFNFIV